MRDHLLAREVHCDHPQVALLIQDTSIGSFRHLVWVHQPVVTHPTAEVYTNLSDLLIVCMEKFAYGGYLPPDVENSRHIEDVLGLDTRTPGDTTHVPLVALIEVVEQDDFTPHLMHTGYTF